MSRLANQPINTAVYLAARNNGRISNKGLLWRQNLLFQAPSMTYTTQHVWPDVLFYTEQSQGAHWEAANWGITFLLNIFSLGICLHLFFVQYRTGL